jgi:two-component system, NtrC family, sensor kinase
MNTAPRGETSGGPVQGGVVLYVDDDASNRIVLEEACSGEFHVRTVSSGVEALEILRHHEVAVLLADQRMPGMTGVELLAAAREQFPSTVRILITAYSDLSEAINAINRAEIRSYLRKPWQPAELKAVLREALETYTTRRRVRALEQRLLETERVYALGIAAAGLGHELRNPLTALGGALEMGLLRTERVSEALARLGAGEPDLSAAGHLVDNLQTAQRMAGQIADVARSIEFGHRRDDGQRSADVGEVVDLSIKCLSGELRRRAHLVVEVASGAQVGCAPSRLGQVVLNLLVNALQSLPDRPRGLNRVAVRLRTDNGRAVLEVEDNGEGIPAEVQEHIFDPFFTTKEGTGSGLGLAISRQIVADAGGEIDVDSAPGRGTRFTVVLPCSAS